MNERIKKLRKALNLTQQEFGKRIGMKQNTIALIEGGRNTSEQTIFAICRAFNVNETWLRNGEGEMFVQISKENQLMEWAGRMLASESNTFKHKFVKMLMMLDESDWVKLEELALKAYSRMKADEKKTGADG